MNTVIDRNSLAVAIVEDRREIREGLTVLIDGTAGFRSAGSYRTMEDALRGIAADRPSLALVDIGLPGMSGVEGIRRIMESYPDVVCVVLSVHDDDERIFEALCAGASGYLLKSTPPSRLLESLKEASEGGAPMSPDIARRVITLFREFRPTDRANYELTPHELRILRMLVDGHNYKTAAEALGVSVNTISFHMRHIYEKIRVHSKSEAVAKALKRRLV